MTDYIYNGSIQQNMTFNQMVAAALANQGGPQPRCRQASNFDVPERTGVTVPLNGATTRYVAMPLLTCAAVIFASAQSSNAYLYHAGGGIVPQLTFAAAMTALGNVPLASVFVIYTFPTPSDKYYYGDASAIATYGVPEANIIYAPKLPDTFFGITSQGIVG